MPETSPAPTRLTPPTPPLLSAGKRGFTLRCCLFSGLLCIFLGFWKGDGGYRDLREYLDEAEWISGCEALFPSGRNSPNPARLRYSIGLPLLSGPFLWVGVGLEKLSGGRVGRRAIGALAVPVLGSLACLWLYEIGILLGLPRRVGLWAAVLLGLGSPLLSYARLFYAEVGVGACLLLGLWAYLRARHASARARLAWLLLSGAGLSGAVACHYASLPLVAGLGVALAAGVATRKSATLRARLWRLAALALAPFLVAAGLLSLNSARYGHPFRTGYHETQPDLATAWFGLRFAGGNLAFIGRWLLRTLWLLPALLGFKRLWHQDAFLAAGLSAGLALQSAFWLCFFALGMFPIRYPQALVFLLAVPLLYLGRLLHERAPRLASLALVLCVLWNAAFFLAGDDGSKPFFLDPVQGPGVQCYIWYMKPFPPGRPEGFGTPAGWLQAAVLGVHLGLGSLLLAWAARLACHSGETV